MSASYQMTTSLQTAAAMAAERATHALLSMQNEAGDWWAELTADTTLESDWVLLQLWLHPPQEGVWNPPNRALVEKAIRSIVARQLPDGGFNIYPQGPADVNATVKAYFAMKLAGLRGTEGALAAAKERILALGGIQAANSYVKINLSLFNLFPREHCPAIPPEAMLIPGNFIYQMSSWTRAIVISLSIVYAHHPQRPVPVGFDLQELFLPGVPLGYQFDKSLISWRNFYLLLDRCAKLWERFGSKAIRRHAIKKAEKWILERTNHTDGLAAIYPPMQYVIMALDLLGYPVDHPQRVEAQQEFDALMVNDGERFFFQPCFSVVWDTAIAAHALGESSQPPRQALRHAADWLLTKEVRR